MINRTRGQSRGAEAAQFGVPLEKGPVRGPETHSWFWHPNRVGVRKAPAHFMREVKALGLVADIDITWNPVYEFYQVWQRAPRIQHPICQGWSLLFNVELGGHYVPLDERVMWKLYDRSIDKNPANGGSLLKYWERVEAQLKADEAAIAKQRDNDRRDSTDPVFDHCQIQVSGCGKSNGSKFSTYLA